MTGASDDSLNNVGLMSNDPFFVDPNIGASAFTNSSLLSSSSVMSSSKFSDNFWGDSGSSRVTSDTQFNTLSQPKTQSAVPKIQTETWDSVPHYATTQRNTRPSHQYPSSDLPRNTLRVALPPEDVSQRSSSPGGGITTHNSGSYGSILELEASPRRFRKHEIPDFYAASQDSLTFNYGSGRYGSEFDSLGSLDGDQSLSIPMPSEPPPALPQRPPKLSSVSPPPLPPKKQSVVMGTSVISQRLETSVTQPSSSVTSNDIYDFIHENTPAPTATSPAPPLPSKENDIPLEVLVKMSVVELSQRMLDGKLPAHLSGMSLFELVEYISKQTREMNEAQSQSKSQENLEKTQPPDIKSSFSDNFETKKTSQLESTDNFSSLEFSGLSQNSSLRYESQKYSYDPILTKLTSSSRTSESITSSRLSPQPPPLPEKSPALTSSTGAGFDDDFSKLSSMSTSTSAQEQSSTDPNQFDKYAVFRELQMEEEISNAWKSPTEEFMEIPEAEVEPIAEPLQLEEPIVEENEEFHESYEEPANLLNDTSTEEVNNDQFNNESFVQEEPFIPNDNVLDLGYIPDRTTDQVEEPTTIPDTIPEIKIDEEQNLFDDQFGDSFNYQAENQVVETNDGNSVQQNYSKTCNGQAIAIQDDMHEPETIAETVEHGHGHQMVDNPAFDDNFGATIENVQLETTKSDNENVTSDKSGWATFDDEQSFEFSSFLSKEEQNSLLNNTQNTQPKSDGFDSDWSRVSFQPRSQSTDPSQESVKPKKFDPFSNRPGTEPPKEWSDAWNDNSQDGLNIDEAFQSSASSHKDKSQSSLKLSNDSIFNNPFTDNFVTMDRQSGAVSATPPVFEGELPCDRTSNTSRQSYQSGEFVDTLDVFDENNSFANSNFKIQAKTVSGMTNSESVDIFKVSADPFDDDFFK